MTFGWGFLQGRLGSKLEEDYGRIYFEEAEEAIATA